MAAAEGVSSAAARRAACRAWRWLVASAMQSAEWSGRRALITGGASGMGLGVAHALAAGGAQVAIGDVRDDAVRGAAAEIGGDALAIELDVTSATSVRDAVATAVERFGGLDSLVTCAGVIEITPLDEITEGEWDRTLDVDLKGTFLCCQAAAPHLRTSGCGRIPQVVEQRGPRRVVRSRSSRSEL